MKVSQPEPRGTEEKVDETRPNRWTTARVVAWTGLLVAATGLLGAVSGLLEKIISLFRG